MIRSWPCMLQPSTYSDYSLYVRTDHSSDYICIPTFFWTWSYHLHILIRLLLIFILCSIFIFSCSMYPTSKPFWIAFSILVFLRSGRKLTYWLETSRRKGPWSYGPVLFGFTSCFKLASYLHKYRIPKRWFQHTSLYSVMGPSLTTSCCQAAFYPGEACVHSWVPSSQGHLYCHSDHQSDNTCLFCDHLCWPPLKPFRQCHV